MRRAILVAGAALALGLVLVAPVAGQTAPSTVVDGAEVYVAACSSCHGPDARGTDKGPSIVDEGSAAVDFVLSTGRMPPGEPGTEARRRASRLDEAEIAALIDYVGALGDGPAVPTVEVGAADVAAGGELYRQNCGACHQAGGAGGSLTRGQFGPSLADATAVQVVEATMIGPGAMPSFPELDDGERAALAAYVLSLQDGDDPGGLALGRVGPVAEGLAAWSAVAVLIGATTLIGRRRLA